MNGKKIGGWIVRDGFAAVGCPSMGTGSIGGENYCGNLLWQSSLTLLPQKTPQKTPQKILAAIRANPSVGTQEMADMIGVERSTVARAIAKLKRDGILRRVGPDKGGHWEVVEG